MASKNNLFTENLKKAIRKTGLDNPDFAATAGLGYSTLMTYLNPNNYGRVPEWDQLLKIANAAGVSIAWLLTGKEDGDQKINIYENTALHDDVEYILRSNNAEAINALNTIVGGIKSLLKQKDEQLLLMKQLLNELQALKQSGGIQAAVMTQAKKRPRKKVAY